MAAVMGSMDSHLFELRNFKAKEFFYRERHSNKTKPARGSASDRSSPDDNQKVVSRSERNHYSTAQAAIMESPRAERANSASIAGTMAWHLNNANPRGSPPDRSILSPSTRQGTPRDNLVAVSRSERSHYSAIHTAIVESPQAERAISTAVAAGIATAARIPTARSVESRGTDNNNRALALRASLGGEEETIITKPDFRSNDLGTVRCEGHTDGPAPSYESQALPSLDEATLKRLARIVVREMQSVKKTKVPVRLDDFTGEKSAYLAEDAVVWLKKLRLAARQNEWDHALALEVASVHLKGLAARWFAAIEKHMNEELHLDRDRWNFFQSQFEERFADYRSRLLQVEKIKELKLRHGEDIREYAEAIMSMNCRLEEPLDDEFLRWVFIHGLPPSELRDKLFKFEEEPHTLASAVKYARRFQLSQSVFNIKDYSAPIPRMIPVSTPTRSVRSN